MMINYPKVTELVEQKEAAMLEHQLPEKPPEERQQMLGEPEQLLDWQEFKRK